MQVRQRKFTFFLRYVTIKKKEGAYGIRNGTGDQKSLPEQSDA